MTRGPAYADTAVVLVDPVLHARVEDFEENLVSLEKSEGEDHRVAAEALCRLSRDIRLRLGPPRDAPPELVETIVSLFREAVDAMHPPADDEQFQAFQNNIKDRAAIIENGL